MANDDHIAQLKKGVDAWNAWRSDHFEAALKGAVTIGRYQLLPDAGRHFLSKDESAKAATNYLEDEIRRRVARGAVRFKVVLQLAAPGDKIDDPSVAWASTNKITTLGTLTVASVVPDSEANRTRALVLAGALACRHRTRGPDD